jgi:hypothetical protein
MSVCKHGVRRTWAGALLQIGSCPSFLGPCCVCARTACRSPDWLESDECGAAACGEPSWKGWTCLAGLCWCRVVQERWVLRLLVAVGVVWLSDLWHVLQG